MPYIAAIVIGYLLGSINSAYICARLKGFDIRTRGSFSAGASNAKITMGWPYFFIVLICDFLKSTLAFFIIRKLFPETYPAAVLAGTAAIFGHCFPFYLQFKGGKGYASYIGLSAGINPLNAAISVVVGLIGAFASNWIVTCTMINIFLFPILMVVRKQIDWLSFAFLMLAAAIILYKHRINFKKLAQHKEIGINGCYVGTKEVADVNHPKTLD